MTERTVQGRQPNHGWMRSVLAYLYDECDAPGAKKAVTDDNALRSLQDGANAVLSTSDRLQMPSGEQGDNLWRALIALRLKFSQEEARRKLERNIELRSGF